MEENHMKIKDFFYNKEKIENVVSVDGSFSTLEKTDLGISDTFKARLTIYFANGDCRIFECQYINVNANTLIAGDLTGKIIIAKLSDQVT